jgi:hypothetical protein
MVGYAGSERIDAMGARQGPKLRRIILQGTVESWHAQKKKKTKILHVSPFLPPDFPLL